MSLQFGAGEENNPSGDKRELLEGKNMMSETTTVHPPLSTGVAVGPELFPTTCNIQLSNSEWHPLIQELFTGGLYVPHPEEGAVDAEINTTA